MHVHDWGFTFNTRENSKMKKKIELQQKLHVKQSKTPNKFVILSFSRLKQK